MGWMRSPAVAGAAVMHVPGTPRRHDFLGGQEEAGGSSRAETTVFAV